MVDRPAYRESEIEARRQAVALATEMLAGRLSYFEGAPQMCALQSEVGGVGDRDPDFDAFAVIVSETDHLPLKKQRPLWSPSALERLAPEFKRTEEWAANFAPDACRHLIARFGDHDS
jgi:hypothetical protein